MALIGKASELLVRACVQLSACLGQHRQFLARHRRLRAGSMGHVCVCMCMRACEAVGEGGRGSAEPAPTRAPTCMLCAGGR